MKTKDFLGNGCVLPQFLYLYSQCLNSLYVDIVIYIENDANVKFSFFA